MDFIKFELAKAYRDEEDYWKHKSSESWLQGGYKNTRFFHGSVKYRRMKNTISVLVDTAGVEKFSEGSKGNIVVDYFRDIFKSSVPQQIDELLNGLDRRVMDGMNDELIREVTELEIRQAMFSINREKTPGADGMSGAFFPDLLGHYWRTGGEGSKRFLPVRGVTGIMKFYSNLFNP